MKTLLERVTEKTHFSKERIEDGAKAIKTRSGYDNWVDAWLDYKNCTKDEQQDFIHKCIGGNNEAIFLAIIDSIDDASIDIAKLNIDKLLNDKDYQEKTRQLRMNKLNEYNESQQNVSDQKK